MHGHRFSTDEDFGKVYDARILKRLLQYIWPHRTLLILATVFLVSSTGLQLLIPYIFKVGIDRYIDKPSRVFRSDARDGLEDSGTHNAAASNPADAGERIRNAAASNPADAGERIRNVAASDPAEAGELVEESIAGVGKLALLIILVLLVKLGAGYGHALTTQIAGQRAMYKLRTDAFRHIQELSLGFFDRNPVGRLVTRVTNDVGAINELFSAVLVALVRDTLMLVGSIVILFALDAKLAMVSLALVPVCAAVALVFRTKVRGAYRAVRRYLAKLNAALTEDISGVKIIQVFRQETRRREAYKRTNRDYFRANVRHLVIFSVFGSLVGSLTGLSIALVLVYGGFCTLKGMLTLGTLVAFLMYVRHMFGPVVHMSQHFNVMQGALAAAERIFNVMDEEPEVKEAPRPTLIKQATGRVEFEHVTFSYQTDTDVLRDVSFTVEPGKSVAIVGPTGAGKTTIINLVCRFYDPGSGVVKLDGTDVREWPFDALRRHVAIVLQDAFVFNRRVNDNIRLGRDEIDKGKILRAAEMVQAREFIEQLPGGFDEKMMERGATLSAGQRQLICFARALAHDPKVLILDEATSNVDPATESLIQRAIETLMKGRTSIIVAHRLSTIKKVDEILVLDDGRILERGTHNALMAKRGIYYNLCLLQYNTVV